MGELLAQLRDHQVAEEVGKPGANWAQVGGRERKKLAPLVRHYMKMAHPFTACVRDNTKRFGKERAERVCAVVKDIGHGGTGWRKGKVRELEVRAAGAEERLQVIESGLGDGAVESLARWALGHGEAADLNEEELGVLDALAEEVVELLVLTEGTDQHRDHGGKWSNLLRQLTKPDEEQEPEPEEKTQESVLDTLLEAPWREDLHPRGEQGRWIKKLAGMAPDTETRIGGVRVSRNARGDFTVYHPPGSPRAVAGGDPLRAAPDPNLAGPTVAADSLAGAVPHAKNPTAQAARVRQGKPPLLPGTRSSRAAAELRAHIRRLEQRLAERPGLAPDSAAELQAQLRKFRERLAVAERKGKVRESAPESVLGSLLEARGG